MKTIHEIILKDFLEEKLIHEEDLDYWNYRLEMLEGKFIHLLIVTINCLISENRFLFLVYAISFYFMRIRTGGYHADSKGKCLVMSSVWYVIINRIVIRFLSENDISTVMEIMMFVSTIIIVNAAPVKHHNLQLDDAEYCKLKELVKSTLFVEIMIAFVAMFINKRLFYMVALSIVSSAVLIIISKIFKQGVNADEEH